MSYVNRPMDDIPSQPVVVNKVVDYHDTVRWGPIISGLVVALATYLVLNALAGAIGTGFLSDSGAPRSNAKLESTPSGISSGNSVR